MDDYEVEFSRSSRKELEALPAEIVERAFGRIERLSLDPRPHGCTKLTGSTSDYRLRIGDYRVIYTSKTPGAS